MILIPLEMSCQYNTIMSPPLLCHREETEIIEGEVVEIQIDRPATGTVSLPLFSYCVHVLVIAGFQIPAITCYP